MGGGQWAQSRPSEYQQNQREGRKLESHLSKMFKEKRINPNTLAITLNTSRLTNAENTNDLDPHTEVSVQYMKAVYS